MCQSQSKERIEKGGVRMKDTTIAVDLAKNVFEIAISREAGKVSKQLRVSRPKFGVVFCETERCHRASRSLRLGSLLGKDVATVGTRLSSCSHLTS